MILLGVMLGTGLEPSGDWDGVTLATTLANAFVYVAATICLCLSPVLCAGGVAIWVLAEQREKQTRGRP